MFAVAYELDGGWQLDKLDALASILNQNFKELELTLNSALTGTSGKTMGVEIEGMVHLMDESGFLYGPLAEAVIFSPIKGQQVASLTFEKSVHQSDDGSGKYLKLDRLIKMNLAFLIQTSPGSYSWLDR